MQFKTKKCSEIITTECLNEEWQKPKEEEIKISNWLLESL
jgi:hypothetical protein